MHKVADAIEEALDVLLLRSDDTDVPLLAATRLHVEGALAS